MEVHHHPEVEKKGIKEYLLEGLMIFIAVMMGFFAESLREHIADREKEHEYIINIKKDLVADTTSLNTWIPTMYNRMQVLDSLIIFLENPGYTQNGAAMYYYARLSTRALKFEPNDNTINELKNSGNFRLIRKHEVVSGIMDFENLVAHLSNLNAVEQREDEISYPLIGELFDASVFVKMSVRDKAAYYDQKNVMKAITMYLKRPDGNPQLRKHDSDKINLLIYYLHQRESSMYAEARMLHTHKDDDIALINLINKAYSLKDE